MNQEQALSAACAILNELAKSGHDEAADALQVLDRMLTQHINARVRRSNRFRRTRGKGKESRYGR
jgi:hypothetical protein